MVYVDPSVDRQRVPTSCCMREPAKRPLAPGLLAPPNYTANGTQYMVATFASDGAYVLNPSTGAAFGLNSRPAKPGDVIIAYGIGFGDVTPAILPGVIVGQSNALGNPVTDKACWIGQVDRVAVHIRA